MDVIVWLYFLMFVICFNFTNAAYQNRGNGYQYQSQYQNNDPNGRNGLLNEYCANSDDCGRFGYYCSSLNKTCQCAENYLPDYWKKTCLGGVNRKCMYDENCIQGAFCMNQESCQCKHSSPLPSFDGMQCSDKAGNAGNAGLDLSGATSYSSYSYPERPELNRCNQYSMGTGNFCKSGGIIHEISQGIFCLVLIFIFNT